MAWAYLTQAIEASVVTDPRDLMVNVNALARAINGFLDRDNVTTSNITSTKPQVKALVEVGQTSATYTGAAIQTIAVGATGQWTEITSLTTSVVTVDGELIVDTDVNMVNAFAAGAANLGNHKWQARMLINGTPRAYTGWVHFSRNDAVVSMTGSAPVSARTSTIQVQVRAWNDPWRLIPDINNGRNLASTFSSNPSITNTVLDFYGGNVVYVHRKR